MSGAGGPARAARVLLDATEALQAAVHADPEVLGLALETRDGAFQELEASLSGAPPGSAPAEVRELVAQVRALDRRIVASAHALQGEVRGELEALRGARQAVRALRVTQPEEAPRFVERRV